MIREGRTIMRREVIFNSPLSKKPLHKKQDQNKKQDRTFSEKNNIIMMWRLIDNSRLKNG